MASTYTPAGIELIGDGEQSTTWGDTTNTNWELIEELATGGISIALLSSTYTLTTTDGVTSNGRHAVITFTGSPGGTCTVTVSPNDMQKVYFVVNNSDQTVTLTQGSGANVSVAASKTKVVYCDGAGSGAAVTDISAGFDSTTLAELGVTASTTELNYCGGVTSAIQTQLDAKAPLASPALTGTPTAPTASYGTNTTQIASTAFVQAALQAVFPIGSIYINASVTTSPATLFGFGTWVEFGDGKVMVGQDVSDTSFDTLEETGGSKDAIVVSHTHTGTASSGGVTGYFHVGGSNKSPDGSTFVQTSPYGTTERPGLDAASGYQQKVDFDGTHTHTVTVNSTGSSGTNANLQPYIVVKMWKRTA